MSLAELTGPATISVFRLEVAESVLPTLEEVELQVTWDDAAAAAVLRVRDRIVDQPVVAELLPADGDAPLRRDQLDPPHGELVHVLLELRVRGGER